MGGSQLKLIVPHCRPTLVASERTANFCLACSRHKSSELNQIGVASMGLDTRLSCVAAGAVEVAEVAVTMAKYANDAR